MIKLLFKMALWLAVGVGVVASAVPLTGFEAASPWQVTVQGTGTGNIEAKAPVLDHPVTLSTSETDVSKTVDLGVVSFLVALYASGTAMGYILKKRRTVDGFTAS